MGSIRIEVAGGVVGTAKGKTFTVSDTNVNRLVAWAEERFGASGVNAALIAWAEWIFQETRTELVNHERTAAASEIVIPDFTAT